MRKIKIDKVKMATFSGVAIFLLGLIADRSRNGEYAWISVITTLLTIGCLDQARSALMEKRFKDKDFLSPKDIKRELMILAGFLGIYVVVFTMRLILVDVKMFSSLVIVIGVLAGCNFGELIKRIDHWDECREVVENEFYRRKVGLSLEEACEESDMGVVEFTKDGAEVVMDRHGRVMKNTTNVDIDEIKNERGWTPVKMR